MAGRAIHHRGRAEDLCCTGARVHAAAGKSAISCQLKPRLDDLLIRDVNAQTLDKLLMWPAQEELSLSYVQQLYRLLAVAFRQACKLDLLPANSMAELKFVHFTTARILPQAARRRDVQLPELLEQLTECFESELGDAAELHPS